MLHVCAALKKTRGVMCVLSIVITVQRYAGLCINSLCYGGKIHKIKSSWLLVAFAMLGSHCQGCNGDEPSI